MQYFSYSILYILLIFSLSAETILEVDFDDHDEGQYTKAMLDADWLNPSWNNGVDEGRVSIVTDPSYNAKSLQVLYPELGVGPSMGGAQWQVVYNEYEEVYASYYILFPNGWDGVKGGKLPGLCGEECPTGGEDVTGYNGFSARYMFRPNMKLVIYCYHMDKPGTYGEDFELDYTFEREVWYMLTQRIKLNTPGQKNGEIQVWVDYQEALFIDTLRFRAIDTVKIDKFYFSTFYGGSTPDWAPLSDQYIYYDEFRIYTEVSGISQKKQMSQSVPGEALFFIPREDVVSIQLFDLHGRKVDAPVLKRENSNIYSVRSLSNGVYILNVRTSQGFIQKRLAIIR